MKKMQESKLITGKKTGKYEQVLHLGWMSELDADKYSPFILACWYQCRKKESSLKVKYTIRLSAESADCIYFPRIEILSCMLKFAFYGNICIHY